MRRDMNKFRKEALKGGVAEVRGFGRLVPPGDEGWIPDNNSAGPPRAFVFSVDDAKHFARGELLAAASAAINADPESRALYAIRLPLVHEIWSLARDSPLGVVDHLYPGFDWPRMTLAQVEAMTGPQMVALAVYELYMRSTRGHYIVWPHLMQ